MQAYIDRAKSLLLGANPSSVKLSGVGAKGCALAAKVADIVVTKCLGVGNAYIANSETIMVGMYSEQVVSGDGEDKIEFIKKMVPSVQITIQLTNTAKHALTYTTSSHN
ncbi:hypothetical protein AYI69_g2523 [Smittium culicis]|uniref:Uncharacterized protein n=1 Tax=Smittium culicis TaxID=133412 RepID=A0A1R1YM91_9FUNG|nr:hypothetical protein AYI69_g2523 [Smittium culicis]